MLNRRASAAIAGLAVIAAAYLGWRTYLRSDRTIIRERLEALVQEVNEGATDGLGLVARAAKIGSFFTPDVTVDVGGGGEPIHGRETVMGMTARLQPRTSTFTLGLKDVTVRLAGRDAAVVDLTATFTRRDASGDESIDAREFDLDMTKIDGEWLIARVAAIEPLNKR